MPANGGFFTILVPSLVSRFAQSKREIADSLSLIFEIFPFLRDAGRRPGAITVRGVGRSQFRQKVGAQPYHSYWPRVPQFVRASM